jgi:hypothetical protein
MNLLPGDVIERPGPWPTQHRGIFVGVDFYGRAYVIHNAKDGRVCQEPFEIFAAGLPVTLIKRVAQDAVRQKQIVSRAQSLLGKPYDLINFNCDHLVTFAASGAATSPQLLHIAGVLFIVAIGIAVTR